MNRYLSFPLVAALLVFVAVLRYQTTPSTTTASSLGTSFSAASLTGLENKLLPYEDAERAILEGWPTSDYRELFSRRAVPQPTLATVDRDSAQVDSPTQTHFLCSLKINSPLINMPAQNQAMMTSDQENIPMMLDPGRFPIHVDRLTGRISIFAESRWQNYSMWRDIQLPKFQAPEGFES